MMRTNIYRRVVLAAWILALLFAQAVTQPVFAATPKAAGSLAVLADPLVPPAGCPALAATKFSNSTPVTILPDISAVTSTITVSGAEPYLWDVNLQTFIQHTFPADLDITIQSPAGTVVTVTTDNGVGNDNVFDGTLWDDSAGDQALNHAYANMTLASPLSPEEPLATFIGEDPNGDWVLTVNDDAAVDGGTLNQWSLSLISAPVLPDISTLTSTQTTPQIITDLSTITSIIRVSGAEPYLWDVNLQTFIQHTFPADLDITIQSPAGTVVTVTTDNGSSNDNVFDGTLWDDSAGDPVADHIYAIMTLASPLSPEEPLATFIGEDPNGDWILTITDDMGADTGMINQWSLIINSASGCPPPLMVEETIPASAARLNSLTAITVNFSKDAVSDGSARAANNPANYLLVEQGVNDAFDTVSCFDGVAGDDTAWGFSTATYNSVNFSVALQPAKRLVRGNYRLFICGTTSIWSVSGQELNYGANDTLLDFSVQPSASAAGDGAPAALPATGFAPGAVTALPVQPAAKAYHPSELKLEIPRLGVQTGIVGVPQGEGVWDVSWLGGQTGWLEGSAFPTWEGNSVITGHVWNADNTPGVFANLKTLQYGDTILIHGYGRTYTYEVRENTRMDADRVQTVMQHEDLAWVTLLTCEEYQSDLESYSARRVVRAVLVGVE